MARVEEDECTQMIAALRRCSVMSTSRRSFSMGDVGDVGVAKTQWRETL